MTTSKPLSRDFLTLDATLDAEFYRRLVGQRIAAREFFKGITEEQAVEKELLQMQNTIGTLTGRLPETIMPNERFGDLVSLHEQKKVWLALFSGFPDHLQWSSTFLPKSLLGLLAAIIVSIAFLPYLFPFWNRQIFSCCVGIVGVCAFVLIIVLHVRYFRYRCRYYQFSLREIAEKNVDAKKKFIDYPIHSHEEVEPLIMRTLAEKFEIPSEFLKLETSLADDVGFVY